MTLTVLTTGAAGFIGSHTALELLNAGHSVIAVDNCCNAYHDKSEPLPESLKRVEDITGKKVIFYSVDIRDKNALNSVFKKVSLLIYLNGRGNWNMSTCNTETIFVCNEKKPMLCKVKVKVKHIFYQASSIYVAFLKIPTSCPMSLHFFSFRS